MTIYELFVVRPHAQDFDGLGFLVDGVGEAMLTIDTSGIRIGGGRLKFLVGRRGLERILGEKREKDFHPLSKRAGLDPFGIFQGLLAHLDFPHSIAHPRMLTGRIPCLRLRVPSTLSRCSPNSRVSA